MRLFPVDLRAAVRAATLVLAGAALLCSCGPGRSSDTSPIVPRIEEAGSPRAQAGSPASMRPRIPLPAGHRVLAIVDARLDADTPVEQVIALKRVDDTASPVRLLVADVSPSNRYTLSCQADTSATSPRVFDLTAADVVGDHSTAIMASGLDREGKRTLDVYRPVRVKGQGLSLRSIASVVADDIRIDTPERGESYTSGQKSGESFTITSFSRDPASASSMDLIRVLYQWQPAEGRYMAGSPERIPAEKVEQKQLEKLYTSPDTDEFESFLDGAWLELRGAEGTTPKAGSIIHFQPASRRVTISTGDTEEVYVWKESLRTLFDRILVIAENDEKNKISRTFSIRASSVSALEITNQGSDAGDNATTTYTRVTEEIRLKYLDPQTALASLIAPPVTGAFLDNLGRRVLFEKGRVSWSEGMKTRSGTCVFFSLDGRDIMSVRFFDDAGAPTETSHFAIDIHEKRDMGRIVRTLDLTPVQMRVSGIEEAVGDRLSLEQTTEIPKK
jgi:hypothetical protein